MNGSASATARTLPLGPRGDSRPTHRLSDATVARRATLERPRGVVMPLARQVPTKEQDLELSLNPMYAGIHDATIARYKLSDGELPRSPRSADRQ